MKWNIKWFVWIAVITKLVDLITAYFILPAESNPIFNWFGGSYLAMVIPTIILLSFILFWAYRKERTEHNHYYFCMALMWLTFVSCFGAWSNIQGILNPSLIALGAAVPAQVKVQYYWKVIYVIGMLPMLLNIITFEVFYRTRKVAHPIEVKIHG